MRVFVPTVDRNVVERLFAGWNGPKLYCWAICRNMATPGFLVTTERLYNSSAPRDFTIS